MSAARAIIPVFVPHAGCKNACIYCNQRAVASERVPSPDDVASEVFEALQRITSPATVAFYGGSFTAIPRKLMTAYLDAVQPFINSGHVDGIRVSTHPASIDDDILLALKHYNVKTIELGAQSMNDEVLNLSGRGHTARDTELAARLVKRCGFELVLQMMVGLPHDTDPLDTARKLLALQPDAVRVYPLVVLRGTELERMWRAGEYKALTVERAAELCAEPLELFEANGVVVIRVGLNPTETLASEVVTGAYHPALGEMARSVVMLRNARKALEKNTAVNITLYIAKGKTSQMVGQKRSNIQALEREFHIRVVNIIECCDLELYNVKIMEK